MGQKKKWSDLSATQRKAILGAAVFELVVTSRALRDLARRPAREVRGPKVAWLFAMAVQPVGPLAYLTVGRRTTG